MYHFLNVYKIIMKILNNKNIIFLHIGKCGGSNIENKFPGIKSIHMNKPKLENTNNNKYVIILRNPIKRFVSAFYHSKLLIDFDITGYTFKELNNNEDSPFYKLNNKIINKMKYNNPFRMPQSDYYKELINFFPDVNTLAESLTSENKSIKKKAMDLCRSNVEHIHKSIGWYLYNGDFIEKNKENIIYCEDISNVNYDYLSIIFKKSCTSSSYLRKNSSKKYNKFLSKKAISNIIDLYKDSDYAALKTLLKYNFISKELFDSYYKYDI